MLKEIIGEKNYRILEDLAIIITVAVGPITILSYHWEWIEMGWPFLTQTESFWLLTAAWLFSVFLLLHIKKNKNRKELEFDELVELTKLPLEDEIITIEPSAYQEVVKSEVDDSPYLHFKFNVHNHSYYLFTPKKVVLRCCNSGKEVVKEVWDIDKDKEYISARKHITIDASLPKYQARAIMFKVPIEKRYADWSTWDFDGYVTYTNGEEERNVKIDTCHTLSDKTIHKLEEMLKNVLGDDIK